MNPTFLNPPMHFTRDEFRIYLAGLDFTTWLPTLPYLHNTGVPSLTQWQDMGSTPQERWGASLNRYYKGMGWHAGPHIVCCPDYIWVLCDLTKPGVAESCSNSVAFGMEMVGNYELGGDDFSSGDGAKVRDIAAYALAAVAERASWGDLSEFQFNVKGLHFHRDCTRDQHACPGSKVTKQDVLARVADYRAALKALPLTAKRLIPAPLEKTSPEFKTPPALRSVEDIQVALNRLGIPEVTPPDGKYGPVTGARVEAFQAANGCAVDGWVGDETRPKMLAALEQLPG